MSAYYLVVIEIEGYTNSPEALARIAQVLVADGLVRLDASGQLAPLIEYRVLQRPVEKLSIEALRVRRMEEESMRRQHQLVEERLTYEVMEQLELSLSED